MPKLVTPLPKCKSNNEVPIPGYREGKNVTSDDRVSNISAIALMMKDDLIKLHKACTYLSKEVDLKSIAATKLFLQRLILVKKGIISLSQYSEDILNLTQKKKSTEYNSAREKASINYQTKMAKQVEKQTSSIKTRAQNPKSGVPLFLEVKQIVDKRNSNMKQKRKSSRLAQSNGQSKKLRLVGGICDENCVYTFHLNKCVVKLDAPKHSPHFYTLRELVEALHDVTGSRKVVQCLHEQGRVCFSHSSFGLHLKAFIDFNIKPREGDFGGKMGRPPIIEFQNIPDILNSKQKENLGFVQDDKKGTAVILRDHLKACASDRNLSPESIPGDVNITTLQRYISASTSLDPDMSSGFQLNNARENNEAREQASRSKRNAAGMIGVVGASFMIPGKPTLPADLPEGTKLFLKASEDANGCFMKPKDKTYLLNFDEVGRWVWSGGSSESKNHVQSKVWKGSIKKETRGVSSVWRSFNSNENTCNGLSCKFLILVSAAGYLAPTCIHFHGLAETELSEDFVAMEVPGLVPGGDMFCTNEVGHVLFTRRRSKKNISEENHNVTISERLMAWYHAIIVVPFTIELREKQTSKSWKSGMKVSLSETFTYRLDSALSYLKYLNRPEIVKENQQNGISVVKIAAAATESWQENDVGKGMRCTASLIRSTKITRQNDTNQSSRK